MIKKNKSLKNIYYTINIIFYLYVLAMFIVAWTPGSTLPQNLPSNSTIIFHFFEFTVLSILLILFVLNNLNQKRIIAFFSIGLGISALTEIGQLFVPGRGCGLDDFFANLSGFLIVPIIILIILEFSMERIINKFNNRRK